MAATLLAAAALPANGQEYKIRGISLQPDFPVTEVHVHQDGGRADAGVVQVKSFLNHEADVLKLKGPKIVLTTQAGAASAKDPALTVGSCTLPAKGGSVILLLLPDSPGKPASKVIVLDDSKKGFPPGSVKVLNLSSLPVKIELEKKPFDFAAGEIRDIPDMPVNDASSAGMKATCERDGKWEVFSSGLWPHPGTKRVLQVITDNPATKLVDIRGFRDVAEP